LEARGTLGDVSERLAGGGQLIGDLRHKLESRLEYCDQSQHPDRAADRCAVHDGQKQPADVQAMFFRIAASLFSHRLISPVRGFGVNPLSTDAVSQPAAALCACP
jgi:hypothetical protein